MQIYKGVGAHSMVKSFLKIGGRVFETKLACNAPPVLQIFNNSKKPHVLKIRSASFECTLIAPNYISCISWQLLLQGCELQM